MKWHKGLWGIIFLLVSMGFTIQDQILLLILLSVLRKLMDSLLSKYPYLFLGVPIVIKRSLGYRFWSCSLGNGNVSKILLWIMIILNANNVLFIIVFYAKISRLAKNVPKGINFHPMENFAILLKMNNLWSFTKTSATESLSHSTKRNSDSLHNRTKYLSNRKMCAWWNSKEMIICWHSFYKCLRVMPKTQSIFWSLSQVQREWYTQWESTVRWSRTKSHSVGQLSRSRACCTWSRWLATSSWLSPSSPARLWDSSFSDCCNWAISCKGMVTSSVFICVLWASLSI